MWWVYLCHWPRQSDRVWVTLPAPYRTRDGAIDFILGGRLRIIYPNAKWRIVYQPTTAP